jgi:hypothetical protein
VALLGNYSALNKNAGRLRAGTTTAGASAAQTFGNFGKNGAILNFALQDGTAVRYQVGFPWGYGGDGWKLPITRGGINGKKADISLAATGTGNKAVAIIGNSTITINASGTGGLVMLAVGSAVITISASGAISGYVLATGSAEVTFAGSATATAYGWLVGGGVLAISGSGVPLGLGWMEGTTDYTTVLTAPTIAAAVWDVLQADMNNSGTAGAALLAAGSAGDPWATLLENYTDDATFGSYVKKLLKTGEFLALK